MREKVGKSRNTLFFQWFGAPEGRKVGSLKRRVRSQLARWEMKSCTPLVARSTFWSQIISNHIKSYQICEFLWVDGMCSVLFLQLSNDCAKNISKCTKHTSFGSLLEVEMSKKCTPLWREAHFQVEMYKTTGSCARTFGGDEVQMSKKCTPLWRDAHFEVKMYKTPHVRATFGGSDVEKVHAIVARSTFRSQNVKKKQGFGPLLGVQMSLRFTTLHYITLHYITLHYTALHNTTLHYTTLQLQLHNYTPLHSTTLHDTKSLHYTTLHYTTLHYLPLHFTTLHYTPLHYSYSYTTTLHYNTLHYIELHYTTPHYITLHYITLHYTTLHYTTLPSTTLRYITLHYTPLHNNYNYEYTTTLHYTPLH